MEQSGQKLLLPLRKKKWGEGERKNQRQKKQMVSIDMLEFSAFRKIVRAKAKGEKKNNQLKSSGQLKWGLKRASRKRRNKEVQFKVSPSLVSPFVSINGFVDVPSLVIKVMFCFLFFSYVFSVCDLTATARLYISTEADIDSFVCTYLSCKSRSSHTVVFLKYLVQRLRTNTPRPYK